MRSPDLFFGGQVPGPETAARGNVDHLGHRACCDARDLLGPAAGRNVPGGDAFNERIVVARIENDESIPVLIPGSFERSRQCDVDQLLLGRGASAARRPASRGRTTTSAAALPAAAAVLPGRDARRSEKSDQ